MLILLSDAITHNEKIIHHKYASVADVVGYHREARTNKTLIALFLKYEESPDWNGFYLEHIPDKYINFYSLEGFDNFTPSGESIKIHLTEYKLDKMQLHVNYKPLMNKFLQFVKNLYIRELLMI